MMGGEYVGGGKFVFRCISFYTFFERTKDLSNKASKLNFSDLVNTSRNKCVDLESSVKSQSDFQWRSF